MATEHWRGTRRQFEAKRGWRATIRRGGQTIFVLEGEGNFEGEYYEYAQGSRYPADGGAANIEKLHEQRTTGTLKIIKGTLPSK